MRNAWQISTKPYPGSHFATFPPELPMRCIRAGTSEKGVCSRCGAPVRGCSGRGSIIEPCKRHTANRGSCRRLGRWTSNTGRQRLMVTRA